MARRLIKAIFTTEPEEYQVLESAGAETLYITNMALSTQTPEHSLHNPALISSWTPLHTAALGPCLTRLAPGNFFENTSEVKLIRHISQLLENPETNVNAKNASGETPLHVACRTNYSKAVAKLINDPDIDVNALDNSGRTPVMASAKYGKEKALRMMLLDSRVELDFRNNEGKGLEDLLEDFSRGRDCLEWISCSQMIKQVRERRSRLCNQQNRDCCSNYNNGVAEGDIEEIKEIHDTKEEGLQCLASLNKMTIILTKDLSQQDMETKNDTTAKEVHHLEAGRKSLECPICLEIMKPPTKIWMCQSTHLICEECKDHLVGGRCPTCRVEMVTLRAFVAEHFADSLF